MDGHARVELAVERGEGTIPVAYVDLDEGEEALVLATLDPLSAMARPDPVKLQALLARAQTSREGLLVVLQRLGAPGKEGKTDPDAVPGVVAALTQPGDLWHLGEHRLLCGDATAAASYTRLLDGDRATMIWTDPPWNVAIGQDSNPRHRQRAGLTNDALSSADFITFLTQFAAAVVPVLAGDLYCVLGASSWPEFDRVLRGRGFHWSATIIWVKQQFVLGRSKYHRRYEPIWYGWHKDQTSSYAGDRAQDDVWEFDRPLRSPDHPTTKPEGLVERALLNSSAAGGLVLDPFLGSGTTLIAAERQSRRCVAMEIDPHYCDVAVTRWEQFTGQKATRERRSAKPTKQGG